MTSAATSAGRASRPSARTARPATGTPRRCSALRPDGLTIDRLPQLHSGEIADYTAQIPLLIDWLGRVEYAPVKEALGRLRACAARSEIERFLDHDQDWVRHEARRALAKLP